MFEWNMLTYRTSADVQVEHVHLPAPPNVQAEHVRLTAPPNVRVENRHMPQSLQMFEWNMYA